MDKRIRKVLDMSPAELKAARKAERKAKVKAGIPLERNARGQYLPGVSGNSLGRPRTALAELCRAEITKHGLVAVLGNIAAGKIDDYQKKTKIPILVSDRINAIRLLLTYGFGMPKHEVDTGDVRIEVVYADQRQVNFTNAAPSPGADHQGVKTIQHNLLRQKVGQDGAGPESVDPSGPIG